MADGKSIMQERAAEAQASSSKLALYRRAVNRMLGDTVAKPRLLAEDVGGNLVGWGADLGQRFLLARWLKIREGEEQTAFHQRYDRTSGLISMGTGAVGWFGAIMTNKSAPLGSLRQAGRTASASTIFFGLNRLISSYIGIPS